MRDPAERHSPMEGQDHSRNSKHARTCPAIPVIAGWEYALETMIQEARGKKTCSWQVEGDEETGGGDFGDGDITLRRV